MRKAILHLRSCDPRMASLIDRIGKPRVRFSEPSFFVLARAIVSQQLSSKAAATIYGRLELAARGSVTPENVLRLTPARMRKLGMSRAKTEYVRDLARRTLRGELDFTSLDELTDQQVLDHLTAVKGVGVWTAQMFLMFSLRRPDILPTGDVGIRNAMQRLYERETPPAPAEMEEIARPWRPYASIACFYLWNSLESP